MATNLIARYTSQHPENIVWSPETGWRDSAPVEACTVCGSAPAYHRPDGILCDACERPLMMARENLAGPGERISTRRGPISIKEIPAPAGLISPMCATVWNWTAGAQNGVSGSRAYAITDAYVALVRSAGAPAIVAGY